MSMVERVAWAIHHDAFLQGSTHDIFDDLMPEVQKIYIRFAIAAIEAMREPTEAMIAAGISADWVGEIEGRAGLSIIATARPDYLDANETDWVKDRRGIWASMIDAALSEKTP